MLADIFCPIRSLKSLNVPSGSPPEKTVCTTVPDKIAATKYDEAAKHLHDVGWKSDYCRNFRREMSEVYDYVKKHGTPKGQPETRIAVAKGETPEDLTYTDSLDFITASANAGQGRVDPATAKRTTANRPGTITYVTRGEGTFVTAIPAPEPPPAPVYPDPAGDGQARTFVGEDGGDWDDAANWSPSGVPGNADAVTIDGKFRSHFSCETRTVRCAPDGRTALCDCREDWSVPSERIRIYAEANTFQVTVVPIR